MFESLIDWISQNYGDARKIVEVGVGYRVDVAERISQALPETEILVTDKDESPLRAKKRGRIRSVADDAMFPTFNLYQGASLLYSLHPPNELLSALEKLAVRAKADLLVVPISDERYQFPNGWKELVIRGRTVGWLFSSQSHG